MHAGDRAHEHPLLVESVERGVLHGDEVLGALHEVLVDALLAHLVVALDGGREGGRIHIDELGQLLQGVGLVHAGAALGDGVQHVGVDADEAGHQPILGGGDLPREGAVGHGGRRDHLLHLVHGEQRLVHVAHAGLVHL